MASSRRVGRRAFLDGVLVGASAASAIGFLARRVSSGAGRTTLPRGVLFGLRVGDRVGAAQVVGIHPMKFGAIPVVLEVADGSRLQVDVLRRGQADAISRTETLSLHLANAGDGSVATRESHGLAVLALGEELARRGAEAPAGLLTFEQRAVRFGAETLTVELA